MVSIKNQYNYTFFFQVIIMNCFIRNLVVVRVKLCFCHFLHPKCRGIKYVKLFLNTADS